jgi:hypothetical protein
MDDACLNDCAAQAAPASAPLVEGLFNCVQANMCFDAAGNLDQACVQMNCGLEALACFLEV